MCDLIRQIMFHGLLDALIEKLRVCGGVKVAIVVRGIIQHLNLAFCCRFPLDEIQKKPRIRLQNRQILLKLTKYGRTDGKHQRRRIEPSLRQHMVDEPTVQTPISVRKGMYVDKPKCE